MNQPDQPIEAPSAAAERIDNERFVVFRGMMTRAASLGQGTTTYYLGQAGLELLTEIEWLRSRLVAWDHDRSATVAERDEALEERDEARAALEEAALGEAGLRTALEDVRARVHTQEHGGFAAGATPADQCYRWVCDVVNRALKRRLQEPNKNSASIVESS